MPPSFLTVVLDDDPTGIQTMEGCVKARQQDSAALVRA
jgi:hypothetical protein